MYKPRVDWLLAITLPIGWASWLVLFCGLHFRALLAQAAQKHGNAGMRLFAAGYLWMFFGPALWFWLCARRTRGRPKERGVTYSSHDDGTRPGAGGIGAGGGWGGFGGGGIGGGGHFGGGGASGSW